MAPAGVWHGRGAASAVNASHRWIGAARPCNDRFAIRDLADALARGTPAVFTRNHHLNEGWLLVDPRPLSDADVGVLATRMREAVATLEGA